MMIHTVANTAARGRPVNVFVNGNRVESAFYADTRKGIVHYYPQPIRVKKNSDVPYSRTLKGRVTVEEQRQ